MRIAVIKLSRRATQKHSATDVATELLAGDMDVGTRIRKLRQELGLTRVELGRRIGVTGAAVGQWEKQRNGVRPKNVEAIARALDKPLEHFYRDADMPTPPHIPLTEDDLIVSALDYAVRSTGVDVQPAQLVRLKMLALQYLKRARD